jgi:hypothetical protein
LLRFKFNTQMEMLTTHARDGGLVVFAGAGISMPAPSSLPSWYLINEVVLESLAQRLEPFAGAQFSEEVRQQLIATRNDKTRHFSPDYHAQIIEDECGPDYFRVLQALDADEWNGCHAAIAALAKAGFVAAVVTTNFDRLLERALDSAGVHYSVYRKRKEYESWHIDEGPLAIIKVHGSVEDLDSMVDTLRGPSVGTRFDKLLTSSCLWDFQAPISPTMVSGLRAAAEAAADYLLVKAG